MNKNGTSFALGDAVVFYSASETAGKTGADHVGLIAGISKGKVSLVNGDWGGGSSISVKGTGYVDLKTWVAENFPRGEKWYLVNPTGK
jgi:hypothetical protein